MQRHADISCAHATCPIFAQLYNGIMWQGFILWTLAGAICIFLFSKNQPKNQVVPYYWVMLAITLTSQPLQ